MAVKTRKKARIGRPPSEDPRSERITVRLTRDEAAAFRRLAREAGAATLSGFLAAVVRKRLETDS